MSKRQINTQQKKFADNYIETGNAYQSAIDAGYTKGTAKSRTKDMLNSKLIKDYIDERLKEIDSNKIASQKEVLEYLTQVMRGEVKEEVLKYDGLGQQSIEEVALPIRERTKAAELIGKRYGTWTDKVDIAGSVELIFEDDYGDEDG